MTHRRSEPSIASVRRQAALARALLDELEAIDPRFGTAGAPNAQAIEELTRLGRQILEAAELLASVEEANEGPPLAKCLESQDEGEPIGVESASYGYGTVDRGRG